jgi:hypothetical protein
MLQIQIDGGAGGLESRRRGSEHRLAHFPANYVSIRLFGLDGFNIEAWTMNPGVRRDLTVRAAPEQLDFMLHAAVELSGSSEH